MGLLFRAKYEGQASSLAEEMDRLREQGNFRIHDALYRRVLKVEKEKDLIRLVKPTRAVSLCFSTKPDLVSLWLLSRVYTTLRHLLTPTH
ncbi:MULTISPECIES: DUF3368 domain-containing protein [unclassified Methanoculleus]|uniref:DUF3368 domain-containing protein n=1 Tax=unclassified Methanoculleus TaxID=2619537 RepID=UPI00374334FD